MARKRQGSMTLDEFHAQLKAEGRYDAYIERKRQQEQDRRKRQSELRGEEHAILDDLKQLGYREVQSVWDFVNTDDPYPEAIPVLFEHLQKQYPDSIREGIARALSVPAARHLWPKLLEIYRNEPAWRPRKDFS